MVYLQQENESEQKKIILPKLYTENHKKWPFILFAFFFKLACLRVAAQFLHVYYFTFHFSYLIKVIIQIKKKEHYDRKMFLGTFRQ